MHLSCKNPTLTKTTLSWPMTRQELFQGLKNVMANDQIE